MIFPFVEAPNRMDSILGREQTYSIASLGEIDPPARTCIAMVLAFPVRSTSSYDRRPPDILNPVLLIDVQIIGFSIPASLSTASSFGIFIVIKPGSALHFLIT